MDVRLELEDVPFPAMMRSVHEGIPSADVQVNQAFLDFYGLDEPPRDLMVVIDAAVGQLDEMDRKVAAHSEPESCDLQTGGRTMTLQKTPVVRAEEMVAVLTVMLVDRDASRQRLQESNRRLEGYAHAAAHDLRSPLRRIRSFSQILQARLRGDEIDRDQLIDFAERIANGAERLDGLLGSMLQHAAVGTIAEEAGEYSDLGAIATDICTGISELSHEPKPSFLIKDLPEVRLPSDAAERVLRNLIDNAIKYSPKDRVAVVEITSEIVDAGVQVRVSDNGIGVEPQFVDKIFQPFNQVRAQATGSGVGLAVVERLLSTRDAKIWVESEVGAGAAFVIEFPIAAVRLASSAGAKE